MTPLLRLGWQRAATLGGTFALLSLAGVGCASHSFERLPRQAVDLGGQWVYVASASDDAAAIITAALPKPRRAPPPDRDTSGYPPMDSGTGQQGGRGGGGQRRGSRGGDSSMGADSQIPIVAPLWGRGSAGEYVRAFAFPAPRLEIEAQPALVTVTQGDRRRSFQPGDDEPFSVTDRFGSRTVRAGWDDNAFIVHSTGGTRLSVLERFRRLPKDELGVEVDFSAQGVRSVKVHSVYRRATASELAAPPAEGPPRPGPH